MPILQAPVPQPIQATPPQQLVSLDHPPPQLAQPWGAAPSVSFATVQSGTPVQVQQAAQPVAQPQPVGSVVFSVAQPSQVFHDLSYSLLTFY